MAKGKTIHIGNKRFPADKVPDKYKHLVTKAGKIVEIAKATPAKPVKSDN